MSTTIEWCRGADGRAGESWNPVTGCTKVSDGCANCYAEAMAKRFWGSRRKFSDVRCHEDRLDIPLRWRKPRTVFVNSMSDLFHEKVPFDFIADVHNVMAVATQHQFIVLTKRPKRAAEFYEWLARHHREHNPLHRVLNGAPINLWLGVSVEDQQTANERIPLLLDTPVEHWIVSYEPALGPVNLERIEVSNVFIHALTGKLVVPGKILPYVGLDGVLAGGESGPHARPCDLDWLRSVRDQCRDAGVPFFLKQLGSDWAAPLTIAEYTGCGCSDEVHGKRHPLAYCSKHGANRMRVTRFPAKRSARGSLPSEWPEDLRDCRRLPW